MLQYLIERLQRAERLDDIIVATSTDRTDDPIERHCADAGVRLVRGPVLDVASRFLVALDAHPSDAFVRISADSPLLDQRVVDPGEPLDILLLSDAIISDPWGRF